jgi:hypothetical protein
LALKIYINISRHATLVCFCFALEAYNLFLQRNLRLKIRDLQDIYSLLSSDEVKVQKDTVKKLYLTFHQKEQNLDKLEPYRQIKNVMQENYNIEIETGVSKRKTLEEWIPILALVTSSVIAILQLFLK